MNGWIKVLLGAGPLGAIVAFLLLQSAGVVPSEAKDAKEAIQAHSAQTQAIQQAQLEVLQQIQKGQQESARLLRIRCVKDAQTDADRQNCL